MSQIRFKPLAQDAVDREVFNKFELAGEKMRANTLHKKFSCSQSQVPLGSLWMNAP